MTVLLAALVIVAIPFLAVSALLKLSERLQDRRDVERDRQVELTDAIHWELGAIAAPVVRRRRGGGWRVSMAIPLDKSGEVAALVSLVQKHFGAGPAAERLQIVLTPPTWNVRPLGVRAETSRQIPTDRPLAA
jgi:hypothetical protein